MKRPSFQFYPADWRNDANLRRCSPAARGVWMDVLCVLHDADQYGVVRWPLKDLASAAGAALAHVRELVDKNVLKGRDTGACAALVFTPRHGRREGAPVELIAAQDGPIWYSSRFVRDEYVRTIRGESSRFGADNDEAPKGAPKPPFGDGSTSSSSSSPSGKESPPKPPRKRRGAGADAPTVSIDQLVAEGVVLQHAKDWLVVRKEKKLPLTPTAWDEVKAEATKAGMTAAQAVHKAVSEGWGGFKAKWLVAEAAKDAKAGVPTANWWDTRSGMLSKGVELGVTPPAKAEFGDGMDTADWIRFQAHVWVKAGDGPWWNEREEPVWRMAKRLRDGGSTDLSALAIAAIRKEPAHA